MKKLLLVTFLLAYHILSYAPSVHFTKEEKTQNLLRCNYFESIATVVSKFNPLVDIKTIPMLSPIDTIDLKRVNSKFGCRFHPVLLGIRNHDGIDIQAPKNTPVYASGAGYVEEVKINRFGYGNYIIINHGNGYKTRYAHLKEINVKVGDYVKSQRWIATTGNSGMTTGPHLHYEILKDGKPIDPIKFITNEKHDYIASLKRIQTLEMMLV